MPARLFLWTAHPKADTLNAALVDAYQRGAEAEGARVRRMDLSDMRFDADAPAWDAPLEPDLRAWQDAVAWADHLLIVHPVWWGAMPARAKAVLDRAMTSGFAFKYRARGLAWDKLLAGRTADVATTSDTPPLIDAALYRKATRRVLRDEVLGFCGVKTRTVRQFGSVKLAEPAKIGAWLQEMERRGARAARRAANRPSVATLTPVDAAA